MYHLMNMKELCKSDRHSPLIPCAPIPQESREEHRSSVEDYKFLHCFDGCCRKLWKCYHHNSIILSWLYLKIKERFSLENLGVNFQ